MDEKLKAKLRRFSKEDLLLVIERMCAHLHDDSPYCLVYAISDREHQKEQQRFKEADKQAEISRDAWKRYFDKLKSYSDSGKRLYELSSKEIIDLFSLQSQAEEADRQWNKLMGIKRV